MGHALSEYLFFTQMGPKVLPYAVVLPRRLQIEEKALSCRAHVSSGTLAMKRINRPISHGNVPATCSSEFSRLMRNRYKPVPGESSFIRPPGIRKKRDWDLKTHWPVYRNMDW